MNTAENIKAMYPLITDTGILVKYAESLAVSIEINGCDVFSKFKFADGSTLENTGSEFVVGAMK